MTLPIILTVPPALPIDRLRDGLFNHHLPATVAEVGRDGVKVTPGQGIDKGQVEAFLKGFIAGFQA